MAAPELYGHSDRPMNSIIEKQPAPNFKCIPISCLLPLGRKRKRHVLLSKQAAIPAINQIALIYAKSMGILPFGLLQKCSSLSRFISLAIF